VTNLLPFISRFSSIVFPRAACGCERRILRACVVAGRVAVAVACLSTAHAADEPTEVVVNSIGMQLAPISAGSFLIGQDGPQSDHQFIKHPEKFNLAWLKELPPKP